MQSELVLAPSTLYGFLLVFARISGAFVFIPIPGRDAASSVAKAALSLAITMAMFPLWPQIDAAGATPGLLVFWAASEAALGLVAGIAISFVAEALVLGAQLLSLQAGYGYASTIDPTTNADAGILLVVAQLLAGLLFFAFGLDRQLLYVIGRSLESWPPGEFTLTRPMGDQIIRLASVMFSVALRLALPVAALLMLIDIALAVLGRISMQLQITSLAFPVKMIVGMLVLAWTTVLYPTVFENFALHAFGSLKTLLAR